MFDAYYQELVPKNPDHNLAYRKWLLEQCYSDEALAREAWIMCSRDILFFANSFAWLLEPRQQGLWQQRAWGNAKEIPFVTRGYQDKILRSIMDQIGKRDIITDKSRETGLSWLAMLVADWYWRFRPHSYIGMCSRDEDSLDNIKNKGSLMAKLDFIDDHLPRFLRPKKNRVASSTHTIENLDNNSVIVGFAAGPNVGRSERYLFFVFDEMHFFPQGSDYLVHSALQYATPCRWMISTVNPDRGQSGAFYDFCSSENQNLVRITADWRDDPEKAAGLYTSKDGELIKLDPTYVYPDGYKFIFDEKIRSPYYDWEWNRSPSPRLIAAELDRDFGGAGDRVFDTTLIRQAFDKCVDPVLAGNFKVTAAGYTNEFIPTMDKEAGDCKFWVRPNYDVNRGYFMDPQRRYAMGVDIAAGTAGTMSSYSAIVVFDWETGEQAFEWRSNSVKPHELAQFSVMLGLFFNNALITPEVTGPVGRLYLDQFNKLEYPNPYLRPKDFSKPGAGWSGKVGLENNDGGERIFGEIQRAMEAGKCTPRSRVMIREFERYYRDKNGRVKHPLVGNGRENAPELSHGDVAIAGATGWYGIRDMPMSRTIEVEETIPKDCWLSQWKERQKRESGRRTYWKPLQRDEEFAYSE